MRGTGLLVRATLRRRWRTLFVLAIIAALGCGVALTALTGAARTYTSWSRLFASTDGPQALVNVPSRQVDTIREQIAARPDVAAAGAFSYMPVSVRGMPHGDQQGMFAGLGPGFGSTVLRPLIVQGRLADPARADEITVNAPYAKLARVKVGDRVTLVGSGQIKLEQPATIVGIHRSPLDIGPNGGAPLALGTPAFMARWWPKLESVPGFDQLRPAIAVRLRPGTSTHCRVAPLASALPSQGIGIVGPQALNSDVEKGLNAGTTAYGILAIASAIATLLLLAFLVSRAMRVRSTDAPLLAALGATRRARAFAAWLPFAIAVAIGVVSAPFLATLASPLVRTGFAKVADPDTGVWIDAPQLIGAAIVLAVAALGAAAFSAWRVASVRPDRSREPRRASPLQRFDRVSSTAEIGAWAAFGGSSAATRRLARSALIAFSAALCCLVAALVWIASVTNLVDDFALQGWNFDVAATSLPGTTPSTLKRIETALESRQDVSRLSTFRQTTIPVAGIDVDVFAIGAVHGDLTPRLTDGHAPQGPDQAAVGDDIARHGHLHLGDAIELPGKSGPVHLTVVGTVVFPYLGNTGFGDTVVITDAAMNQITTDSQNTGLLIDLAPGAKPADIEPVLAGHFTLFEPFSPPTIQRLDEARSIYLALVAFFALLAFVVFAFALVTNTQRRFREYAVVRAIGFTRPQVFGAFRWQAIVSLLVAAALALPIGIVLGRVGWQLSARNLGVFNASAIPVARLVLGLVAAALVMTAIATIVAIRPACENVARALRSE